MPKELFTDAELADLLEGVQIDGERVPIIDSTRDRALLAVLAYTGLRISEAAALRPCDIRRNGITQLHVRYGKGKKERTVLLLDTGLPYLDAWLRERDGSDDAPIFLTTTGNAITQQHADRVIRRAAGRAGIPRTISAHTFRHYFTTRARHNNWSMGELQIQLGHSSSRTTEHYCHALGVGINADRLAQLART